MEEIKIFDNHKIPRRFRVGYRFYIYDRHIPECDGDGWKSKCCYLTLKAVPEDKGRQLEVGSKNYFSIKASLCAVQTRKGGAYVQKNSSTALKTTHNTG